MFDEEGGWTSGEPDFNQLTLTEYTGLIWVIKARHRRQPLPQQDTNHYAGL